METTADISMAQEKQTYTARELATLLGADIKTVFNAKHNKRQNVVPGTKRAAVLSGMASLGITWDQIVLTPAPVPVSELAGSGVDRFGGPDFDILPPMPETDVTLKNIPEAPASELPTVELALGNDIDSREIQADTESRQAEAGLGIDADMSLEDIFGELWRRLPGATVIVTRQE